MFEEATDGEDRREDQMIINKKEGEEKVKWGEQEGREETGRGKCKLHSAGLKRRGKVKPSMDEDEDMSRWYHEWIFCSLDHKPAVLSGQSKCLLLCFHLSGLKGFQECQSDAAGRHREE